MQLHDPQHAQHDPDVIAGLAAGGATAIERTRGQALLDSCVDCRALHDDLVAIAAATRSLPAARAPRDFRITAEQAARLRRTSWLTRLLGPFASAGSAARPLAAAFTTLGLVGIFVASALPGMLGGAASMAAPESQTGAGAGAPAGAAGSQAPGTVAGPTLVSTVPGDAGYGAKDNTASQAPAAGRSSAPVPAVPTAPGAGPSEVAALTATEAPQAAAAGATDSGRNATSAGGDFAYDVPAPTPPNPLLIGSIALLAVGLLLFALRSAGRRLRA